MQMEAVIRRLAELKQEIAELRELNERYRAQKSADPTEKAASHARQIRLEQIKLELSELVGGAKPPSPSSS
jgi:ABC-type uncharacterized transport system fused permease/ATPase subunit